VNGRSARLGATLLAILALATAGAGALTTSDPAVQHSDFVLAPPMPVRLVDASGRWRAPFVYPLKVQDRLSRTYLEDRARPLTIRWLTDGRLASVTGGTWFPMGTDALGRDVSSRLVTGARLSLGVALIAAIVALATGALLGGIAATAGGILDDAIMRVADFVITLPALYVVLTLRAAMPLVLTTGQVFWTMTAVLAAVGWPLGARGVRAIVAAENRREYADAARAAGAGRTRILLHHLMPATTGLLFAQAGLLVPAFILAEATLSYAGLGFPGSSASWGVMLQEAGGSMLVEAPWLLAPAVAIFATVLAVNLMSGARAIESQPM
jgi:peptide/nickel transport system permease protein